MSTATRSNHATQSRISDSVSFRPLSDKILVERQGVEEKSQGGIFIPQAAQEKPQVGKVLAVGAGKRNINGEQVALDVCVGDMVLFTKWAGTEAKEVGENRVIITEGDILGVLD